MNTTDSTTTVAQAPATYTLYNRRMARFDDTYPIRLRSDYDASVSRWLWLVKWLLLIPHFIVLFFLHIALFVVTVIAFFAILFTGRYPRGLFDFSVGVLRWSGACAFTATPPSRPGSATCSSRSKPRC